MNNNKKRGTVSSATFIEDESLPETLNDVLHNSELRRDFRSYLRARFADESLFFYENIELYEQIDDHRYDARQKAGRLLVIEFVIEDSPNWVNIPATIREGLVHTLDFLPESFDAAKREVFHLMSANFLDPFRRHLQGTEVESAPKLSTTNRLTNYEDLFHMEEVELADRQSAAATSHTYASQSNVGSTNADHRASMISLMSVTRFECNCKKGAGRRRSSVRSMRSGRTTQISENGHGDGESFCCEKRKRFFHWKLLRGKRSKPKKKKTKGLSQTQSAPTMSMPQASNSRNTPSQVRASQDEPKKSGITRFRLFNRRPISTKAMLFWQELEEEQKMEHQV